jgi:hypothetical protein
LTLKKWLYADLWGKNRAVLILSALLAPKWVASLVAGRIFGYQVEQKLAVPH